jgi:hypothetical protein
MQAAPRSATAIDAGTPVTRDRYVDLLRALSLTVVVVGHWLLAIVTLQDGTFDGQNALGVMPGAHILTWVLQVMPLFFFAGGFSNAVSWRATKARGEGYGDFVRRRFMRLVRPTAVFVTVWTALALVAPSGRVHQLASVVGIPLWFLAVYLILVAVAPLMLSLHERFGLRVVGFLIGGAIIVDVATRGFGVRGVGWTNFMLVWLLPHQLGAFYADGSLARAGRRTYAILALGGLGTVIALTFSGLYPISMVGVPGAAASNNSPPSVALAAHCIWMIGAAMLARPAVTRWLARPKAWSAVVRLNLVAMTMFLWHMTAMAIGALMLFPAGFPQPTAGSVQWWLLRPVWIVALGIVLAAFVLAFGRIEAGARGAQGRATGLGTLLGTLACVVATVTFARIGFAPEASMLGIHPAGAVVMFAGGGWLLARRAHA